MRKATKHHRLRRRGLLSIAVVFVTALVATAASADGTVVDLPVAGGVERVLYLAPARPAAVLVMFTGGDGVVGLQPDGRIGRPGNFLVRTRQQWLDQGFAVAIPDVPSTLSNLTTGRLDPSYAEIMRQVVAFAHGKSGAPVWLVGTSRGTVAAASGAANLSDHEIAGLVLTSTVTRAGNGSSESVFGANLAAIHVPVLIVSHEGDRCRLTPPSDRPQLKAALTGAPAVDIVTVSGGLPAKSGPCEAMAEHGYYGVESAAVSQIAAWIKSH
jgi:hypothetical protein